MKGSMPGPRTEEKNDETDINPRAAQTERKRTVGVILHGVQESGPHEAGIAGAAKRPRLAGKYQPGAGSPHAGMPALKRTASAFPVPVGAGTRRAAVEFVAELARLFQLFGIGGGGAFSIGTARGSGFAGGGALGRPLPVAFGGTDAGGGA